ncbi:hypothetical protein [Mesotoga sp.]|jgi:hypothetical protein|uniref:DUF4139 domain-containing protein n=1 Tax=Mesotoga infera TaxID=1236046 RepID=A0A101I8W3_9BACT|nr:MAG: Uncharacterized protein XD86_0026 [Mesotoga infera]KUK90917.1 MAG: Uncharacterized protein XE02_0305 [Mesotoga infera]HCO70234.1 hypothetical protein [Mesotoga infera]
MRKIITLTILVFLAVVSFSEHLYIFNGFSILTGELTFEEGEAVIEVPFGVQVSPDTLTVLDIPKSTLINFIPGDSVQSLYEKNIGKQVKYFFDDGRVEMLEVVSALPVFRNSYGEILVNPKGSPVFTGEFNPNGRFLLTAPESFSGQSSFAYQMRNNSWTVKYSLSLENFLITGLMVIYLEFDTEGNVTLVSSNPNYGYTTRDMAFKSANESYSVSPSTSDAETRLYEISVPLKRGTNHIAFLSEVFAGKKRLVFRANRGGSGFSGVDIDVSLDKVPIDLPSGIIEIWNDSVYIGSAGIGNIAAGESVTLQSIARSIEITGRKSSVTTKVDSNYRYYKNTYFLRNLSEEAVDVEIEDYLGQNVDQLLTNFEGEFRYVKESGIWSASISVKPGETAEVEIEYRVRYAN